MFARTTDSYGKIKYLTLCKACKSLNVRTKRKEKKELDFVSVYDPTEHAADAFKDDPRAEKEHDYGNCLLYTSPSPRDLVISRMPSSA